MSDEQDTDSRHEEPDGGERWRSATPVAAWQPKGTVESRGGYDPGEHTVDEVQAYLAKHPDERDQVLAAEAAGKARVTLAE